MKRLSRWLAASALIIGLGVPTGAVMADTANASTAPCLSKGPSCGNNVNRFGNGWDVYRQNGTENNDIISFPNGANDPATDWIRTSPSPGVYRFEYAPKGVRSGLFASDPNGGVENDPRHGIVLRKGNIASPYQKFRFGGAGTGGRQLVNMATGCPVTTTGKGNQLLGCGTYLGGSFYTWMGGKVSTPVPTPTPTPTSPSPTPTPTGSTAAKVCPAPSWNFTTTANDGTSVAGGYYVYNNKWNAAEAGPQTLCVNSASDWMVTSDQKNLASDPGSVKTYPEVQKNYNNVPLGSFTTLNSTFGHIMPAANLSYDAEFAYDIWLNDLNKEVMIWTDNHGQTPAGSKVATVTLSGHSWDLYVDSGYYAYVPSEGAHLTSGSLDLLSFLKDLQSRNYLSSTDKLWQVNYGPEIAWTTGPMNFQVTNFSVTSNPV